jgi:hypothetical protein
MSIESGIMNLNPTSEKIGKAIDSIINDNSRDLESKLALAYRMGFRDARHAGSEIAAFATTSLITIDSPYKQRIKAIEKKVEEIRLSKKQVNEKVLHIMAHKELFNSGLTQARNDIELLFPFL